jgi:hypothetical protein
MHRPVVNEYSADNGAASIRPFLFLNETDKSDRRPIMEEGIHSRRNHHELQKLQGANPS